MLDETLKTQAIAEALDHYLYTLKRDGANQAAIDLYTELLTEVDPEEMFH